MAEKEQNISSYHAVITAAQFFLFAFLLEDHCPWVELCWWRLSPICTYWSCSLEIVWSLPFSWKMRASLGFPLNPPRWLLWVWAALRNLGSKLTLMCAVRVLLYTGWLPATLKWGEWAHIGREERKIMFGDHWVKTFFSLLFCKWGDTSDLHGETGQLLVAPCIEHKAGKGSWQWDGVIVYLVLAQQISCWHNVELSV